MTRNRLALVAMIVVVLAVGAAANAINASHLATGWHTTMRGEEGTDVTVANLQVHVHGAAASPRLEDVDMSSPGSFVLVDISYATTDEWATPEEIVLIDGDGREYTEPSGFGSSGRAWQAGPDIWYRGTLLFEVPDEVTGDLRLEIRPERPVTELPTSVLRVPLTVTVTTEPLPLESPEVLAVGER